MAKPCWPVGCGGPVFWVNFWGETDLNKKTDLPNTCGVNFVGWIFWGTDLCLGEFCWVNFGNWVIHSVRSGLFVANRRPFLINSMWKNHLGSVLFCYSSLWLLLRQNILKYIKYPWYPSKHPMELGVCYGMLLGVQSYWKPQEVLGSHNLLACPRNMRCSSQHQSGGLGRWQHHILGWSNKILTQKKTPWNYCSQQIASSL